MLCAKKIFFIATGKTCFKVVMLGGNLSANFAILLFYSGSS